MPSKPIPTLRKAILVGGKVFWTDSRQRIDLKKPIRDLIDRGRDDTWYVMEVCMSQERLMERAKELAQEDVMPVLLYFTGEEPLPAWSVSSIEEGEVFK